MPNAPRTPCRHPGCPAACIEPYCSRHKSRYAWSSDGKRRSRHQRGYGNRWDKIRAQVRREEPLCRLCTANGRVTPTEQIDHIVPKSKGGTDERSNLQGLCGACHTAKTCEERKK